MKNFSKTILLFTLFSFLVTSHSFAETNTQCHDNVYVCRVKEMWARMSGGKTPTTIEKPKSEKETVITPDPKETPTELNKLLTPDSKANTNSTQTSNPISQTPTSAMLEQQRQLNATIQEEGGAAFQNKYSQPKTPPIQSTLPSIFPQNGSELGGDFACKKNAGGSVTGGADCKPVSQGGKIKDELYNAVRNAAEASGAKVNLISCLREGATVAGTGKQSKHAIGEALDVKIDGANDSVKTKFIVYFMANTKKFNSVGSYEGKLTHTHLGADCGTTWCPFGAKAEPWKELAFKASGLSQNMRPPKVVAWSGAKRASFQMCGN